MFFRSVTSGFYRFWLPPGYLQLRFRVVTSSFYRFHFGYLRYFQLLHIPKLMSPCIPPPDNKGSTINYLGGVVQNEKKIHWEGRRKKKNGHVGGSPKKNGSRKSAPLPPPRCLMVDPKKTDLKSTATHLVEPSSAHLQQSCFQFQTTLIFWRAVSYSATTCSFQRFALRHL